jgi:hypothetical protein
MKKEIYKTMFPEKFKMYLVILITTVTGLIVAPPNMKPVSGASKLDLSSTTRCDQIQYNEFGH